MALRMLGVIGCGAVGGFAGWVVGIFTAPWDMNALEVLARDIVIGTAGGLAAGVVVFS